MAGFAVTLLDWATDVRIVTDGRALECEDEVRAALDRHGVEVIEDTVRAMVGDRDDLRGLELAGVACAISLQGAPPLAGHEAPGPAPESVLHPG